MPHPSPTRREFLVGSAGAALAAALPTGGKSRVVLVRDEHALTDAPAARREIVTAMLDQAVSALTDQAASRAWSRLLAGVRSLGVKTNVMMTPTTPELEAALVSAGTRVGIAADAIRIADRDARRQLVDCDALINVCRLKTHWLSGLAGAVKNYLPFDEQPQRFHDDACRGVGAAWLQDGVRRKTRLVVLDCLRPLFHGGPQVNSVLQWNYCGLLVSLDPVAVDTVALRLLERQRRRFRKREWPLIPAPVHVEAADRQWNIGRSRWQEIELVALGWETGRLL